uniref:UVR domain-containing protein n=1 Tax=Attheya septentrionalis TaxID=420275 RepID=A0A7S2XN44_9STRA
MALSELESQKKSVVLAVCESFSILQTQLESFQIDQSNMERDDGSEAMERFAATSKVLWAENERLNNEVKHVERDESLVTEERNELESSISEQTSEMEQVRDTASTQLNVVNEEIEELKKLLAEKEAVASELTVQVAEQEASIHRVRTKFSRQLNKIYKKEATVNENRNEWETEKSAYDQMKEEHEATVKSHSEALLAHEDMMSRLQHEIDSSQSMEKVIQKEIQFDNSSLDDDTNTNDDVNNEEMAKVQAQVVECEAAVDEANQVLVLATGIISGLKEEIRDIDTQIPSLEEAKKSAAVKRDFRAAGKAAKQIKEMMARKETCEEELEFEAADRLKAAQDSLQEVDQALTKQQAIAHEQEKKHGIGCMARLAKKIKRIEQKRIDSNPENTDDSCITVTSVGMWVLSEEISALKMEGEALGDKFGGWEAIMEQVEDFVEEDTEEEGSQDSIEEEIVVEEEEQMEEEMDERIEEEEETENVVVDAADVEETRQEAVEKFKELSFSLQNAEKDLEDAVAEEDFEKAAELDEILQQVQNKIEALGLSSKDLEALDNVANHDEEMIQPVQDDAPIQDAHVEEEVPTNNTEEIEVDAQEDDTMDDGVVVDVEEATVPIDS